ncbi:MAG: hypothetical protein BJ554DRAFT_1812 [Olpidium bornovanus]|uniref:Uncharacterized protein n=1 Tax=Olpidium bornovanus TaxID=278681 RepID=A0A8H8DGT4_9FUNG|nr:MAG: hypothetical protein BJ554DRAFT_1812 [Olpidium bornovanus]
MISVPPAKAADGTAEKQKRPGGFDPCTQSDNGSSSPNTPRHQNGIGVKPGHGKGHGERLDVLPENFDLLVVLQCFGERFEHFAPAALLYLEGNLNGAMEQLAHHLEVLFLERARGECGGADAHAARREGGDVAVNGVLVNRDAAQTEKRRREKRLSPRGPGDRLHLAAGELLRPQVPKNQVVIAATGDHLVPITGEHFGKPLRVLLDLDTIFFKLRSGGLLQGHGDGGNGVVVRATLARRKHCLVHPALQVRVGAVRSALAEENKTGARTAKGLHVHAAEVSRQLAILQSRDTHSYLVRGRGDDIAKIERAGGLTAGDEPADVRHVAQKTRPMLVCDLKQQTKFHPTLWGTRLRRKSKVLGGRASHSPQGGRSLCNRFSDQPGKAWTQSKWKTKRSSSSMSGIRG